MALGGNHDFRINNRWLPDSPRTLGDSNGKSDRSQYEDGDI